LLDLPSLHTERKSACFEHARLSKILLADTVNLDSGPSMGGSTA
ncbi:MAG: hypothetical protein ACJAQ3_002587, partial [Planctomycetota bacterium]